METTIPVLIELFAATKQTEGKSKSTVIWYRRRLSVFCSFLGDNIKLADLALSNARAFVAFLQDKESRYEGHPITKTQEGGIVPILYPLFCPSH